MKLALLRPTTQPLISRECPAELASSLGDVLAESQPAAQKTASAQGTLTQREAKVIALVAQGQSNKEIARSMGISAETVKTHLKNVFEKLGVQQRAQAVLMARSLGLLCG